MAPEQTLPGAKIDTRTDIYAASALLAQLASGESPDPVRRVSNGVIDAGRPLSVNISGPLTAVVLRGLDTDPDGRQQTIEQWLEEVERGLDASDAAPPSTPPANPPANPPAGFARSRRRRRVLVAAVAVVTLAGAAAVIAARSIGGDRGGSGTALPAETGALTVTLSGPTAVKLGAQAAWFVDSPNAIDGTWSLTGEVQPDPPDWNPGNYFQGTWNVEGTFTLTLTVSDAEGNEAADSHDFTVEP